MICVLSTVLLRIEFTASDSLQPMGELLPRLSILTGWSEKSLPAVYFCCTFPEVAFGGRYPLSLPCGARTFLIAGPFGPATRLSVLLDKVSAVISNLTGALHFASERCEV